MPAISQRALDLIVECEVSSRDYYEKHYRRPEWPGEASGVTIGIGYDLGYATLAKERADWGSHCDAAELRAMDRCVGVTGSAARDLLPSVRGQIDIGWPEAMQVFLERDVPQWIKAVCDAIPGADKLPPDCLGALVSLAYNRGASFKAAGERYKEMRDIRAHVMAGALAAVPDDIRAMKRLWTLRGLKLRRDAEAKLFEDGLRSGVTQDVPLPPPRPSETPPRTLPPAPSKTEGGAAGGATGAGGVIAAAQSGLSGWELALIVIGVVIVAGLIAYTIHKLRAGPTLARAKDQPPSEGIAS